jgi:hypothetical protein
MRKIWPTFLVALVLGWLLAWGPLPAGAYYPPLQATGSSSDSGFSFSVTLPQGGTILANGGYVSGTTVSNFINNRIMAWVVSYESTSTVEYCTFDPYVNNFISGSPGEYYAEVSQLTVTDGVVAYIAKETPSGPSKFCYATYDPVKGDWQNRSWDPQTGKAGATINNLQITAKDGVVAFSFSWEILGYLHYEVDADIYDALSGKWSSKMDLGVPDVVYSDTFEFTMAISNATVYVNWSPMSDVTIKTSRGYDAGKQAWYNGPTKPLPYFAAQPNNGPSPLWVWFTDLSIGASSIEWSFGDGSTPDTKRSTYHEYTTDGVYLSGQKITSPGNSARYQNIYVGVSPPSWLSSYASMASADDLTILRQYRDEVLSKDPHGKVYKERLYANSDAALTVLMDNPELLGRAKKLIEDNLGAVIQVLQGHEGYIYDPEEVLAFLQSFEEQSPPQLKALINVVQKEMRRSQRQNESFLGFRLGAKGRGRSR